MSTKYRIIRKDFADKSSVFHIEYEVPTWFGFSTKWQKHGYIFGMDHDLFHLHRFYSLKDAEEEIERLKRSRLSNTFVSQSIINK